MLKKGEIYKGVVAGIRFPDRAYAVPEDENGKPMTDEKGADVRVMVKHALPAQRISFRLTKKKKGRYEGRLIEVLSPSPDELTEGVCAHAGVCGGCSYQTLPYEKQLELKEAQMRELFAGVIPDFDALFEGIHPSPRVCGYRNKMEYTFGDAYKDGPLSLGMHKRGGFYDIITVDDCRITDGDFRMILRAALVYFSERNISYYHRMRHEGYLRHLLVRKGAKTGEILIDLITSGQVPEGVTEEKLLGGFCAAMREISTEGVIAGILHTRNDSLSDAVKDEGTRVLYGKDHFYEELLGLSFKITPFSFFQTNSPGAEVLYQTARDYIGGSIGKTGGVVYDLYSGTGTIAQMLAPAADQVIGVEIVPEAVEAARENAAANGLDNCTFIAGDVLKVLDEIETKPDHIILDPPRDGVHPKALKKIIAYGVPQIVYISCKPTSLVRDLEQMKEGGYQVERISCTDMFPGTVHVECVCLLSNKNAKRKEYVEIGVDADDYYKIKDSE